MDRFAISATPPTPLQTSTAHGQHWLSSKCQKRGGGRPAVLTHDEILDCTTKFPARLSELADVIAGPYNEGPFPLVHVDYGHNNIIVDAGYNMLGVIDWEYAIATPCGMVEFPLAVSALPVAVDAPWNYNPDGSAKAADGIAQHKDREGYLQVVRDAESELGIPPKLSEVLRNEKVRDVTAAMKLFSVDGKPGFFSRVLDAFDGAEDG